MRVAFVGKGGSGKTTLAALFTRFLVNQHEVGRSETGRFEVGQSGPDQIGPGLSGPPPVLAFDADINQHLAAALGATEDEALLLPALGDHLPEIKEYLRGANPRISSAAAMVKTTPPGRGSRLLDVAGANPLYDQVVRRIGGVRLAVTGPFATEDLGVACYHSKVGAVELILNHLVDGVGEYVVVDMTAGADSFASGLFTRFDLTVLVCEPTLRSIGVFHQYTGYAADFDVPVVVVGNKVDDETDVDFLREHVGADLLTWVGRSGFVKAAERGDHHPIDQLEAANRDALRRIRAALDARSKDWHRFQLQAVAFHLRNASAWASERAGEDLAHQIDPAFTHGPGALAAARQLAGTE